MPERYFLEHRNLWNSDDHNIRPVWLYKQDDIGLPEIKESPPGDPPPDSLAYQALDYSPFQEVRSNRKTVLNPTPDDAELARQLAVWIDMDSMLRLGAVNAYTDNPDELFNKGKNFYWADFAGDSPLQDRRRHFPWDLDAVIRSTSGGIYGTLGTGKNGKANVSQHPFQEVILNHAEYRSRYNAIMLELLDGPLSVHAIHAALDEFQAVLIDALEEDPNSKISDVPYRFDALKTWIERRDASVREQVAANDMPKPRDPVDPTTPPPQPPPGEDVTFTGASVSDGGTWTATITFGGSAGSTTQGSWSTKAAGGCAIADEADSCSFSISGIKNNVRSVSYTDDLRSVTVQVNRP
jgi:hypothetical protein